MVPLYNNFSLITSTIIIAYIMQIIGDLHYINLIHIWVSDIYVQDGLFKKSDENSWFLLVLFYIIYIFILRNNHANYAKLFFHFYII